MIGDHALEKQLVSIAIQSSWDAERCLRLDIGGMLDPVCAAIWAELPAMLADGVQVHPTMVSHRVPCATPSWMAALDNLPLNELSEESIATLMRDHYAARRADICRSHAIDALSRGDDSQAIDYIQSIMGAGAACGAPPPIVKLSRLYQEHRGPEGGSIPTGYGGLDAALGGGLRPGSMWIVGGRTSCRKTSVMLRSALELGRRGVVCGYVSLEDDVGIIGERMALMLGFNPASQKPQAVDAIDQLGTTMIHAPASKPSQVVDAASHLVAQGAQILYVDYVQSIQSDTTERYDLVVGGFASSLRKLAEQHQIPIVLGSQVTDRERARQGKDEPRPRLGDLREAGSLANMADVVTLQWKPVNLPSGAVHGYVAKCKWRSVDYTYALSICQHGMVSGMVDVVHGEPPIYTRGEPPIHTRTPYSGNGSYEIPSTRAGVAW